MLVDIESLNKDKINEFKVFLEQAKKDKDKISYSGKSTVSNTDLKATYDAITELAEITIELMEHIVEKNKVENF